MNIVVCINSALVGMSWFTSPVQKPLRKCELSLSRGSVFLLSFITPDLHGGQKH